MFLDFREALDAAEAADGVDLRALITTRRAEYERELGRVAFRADAVRRHRSGGAGAADAGRPRHHPRDGGRGGNRHRAGPGRPRPDPRARRTRRDLVAPTTDPGWTPLFLTAAGLVTETGSPIAHGPTVAREYGIPAVICVRDATSLITTGQVISIDGAAGTVVLHAAP